MLAQAPVVPALLFLAALQNSFALLTLVKMLSLLETIRIGLQLLPTARSLDTVPTF